MKKGEMMNKKLFIAFSMLISIHLVSNAEDSQSTPHLKAEFNVGKYWREGMTWDEFNRLKLFLERPELVKTQDKIEQQKIAKAAGLKVAKTYIASREKIPLVDLISILPTTYVAKATHLSWSDGLLIVKDGINILTNRPITPEQVEEHMHNLLETKTKREESWAFHQVQPGFMIQEYIPHRTEVKIQTTFGKAIAGVWFSGETNGDRAAQIGTYGRSGNKMEGTINEAPQWWPNAIAAAELLAKNTDALRLDFFIRENSELLLNEIEFYPLINWHDSTKQLLMKAVNKGYRRLRSRSRKA